MTQRRIMIIGNSHVHALQLALRDAPQAPDVTALRLQKSGQATGPGEITKVETKEVLSELTPDDLLVLSMAGSFHNIVGLINHKNRFTIAPRDHDDANTPLIPRAAFQAEARTQAQSSGWLWNTLKAAPCPAFHLMPPPPKRDLSHLESAAVVRGVSIKKVGFAPPGHRLRLWQAETEVISALCAAHNATNLLPPPDCLTEDGFLDPAFSGTDATHANADYGAVVLAQLRSRASAPIKETQP